MENGFSKDDIFKGIEVLKTQKITMGEKTLAFEKEFAKKMGVKYALMVNSGSSANLLAAFAACNPLRKKKIQTWRRGFDTSTLLANIVMAISSNWT